MAQATNHADDQEGIDPEGVATLRIRQYTRRRLSSFGEQGQTHDEVINRLMDMAESWEEIDCLSPRGDARQ